MAVYDDKEKKQYGPEELKKKEDELCDHYDDDPSLTEKRVRDDIKSDEHQDAREAREEVEGSENKSLEEKLREHGESIKESDAEDPEGGFFRDDGKLKAKGRTRLGGLLKNKKILGGLGGGALGLIVGGVFLFNFLSVFQLDHFLNNVDASTFARFNATFDRRTESWTRAYIKLRLAEMDGETGRDNNLFFRSGRVDTDSPTSDWYRTLRSNGFEKKVFNDNGIYFTSMVGPGGEIRPAKISISDTNFDFDPRSVPGIDDVDFDDLNSVNRFLNTLDAGALDQFITQDVFESDRDARLAIKKAVNDKTHWSRVIKRRHLRADIANRAGVREWRFFEKTRDKIDDRRIGIQRKIIQKVFVGNGNASKFMKCILAAGDCPRNADPGNPDNKAPKPATGDALNQDDDKTPVGEDDNSSDRPDGDAPDIGPDGNELSDEITESAEKVVADIADEAAEQAGQEAVQEATESASRRIAKEVASRLASVGPQKIWSVLKTLAGVHTLLNAPGGQDSKLETVVNGARSSQYAGIYATKLIARDQIKSGELIGDEMGAFFETTKGFANSEGWQQIQGNAPGTVGAQEVENADKKTYCEPDYPRSKDEFAWLCDDQKPNNGGKIGGLVDNYNKSFGKVMGPVASGVKGVQNFPIIGDLLDKVDEITGAVASSLLQATGLKDNVETIVADLSLKLLSWVGAGPLYDGTQAGVGNFTIIGSSVTAEGSTRTSGGFASTKESLEFSNRLASEYAQEQSSQMSARERYASLENPKSLASQSLATISTSSPGKAVASTARNFANFGWLTSFFRSPVKAQTPSSATAEWAGVDTYDMPEVCMTMDQLTAGIYDGTNFDEFARALGGDATLTWDNVRDSDAFYEKVYSWAGDNAAKLEATQSIYNCHLLDARIMGGMGNLYGYNDDHGYELSGSSTTSAGTPTVVADGEAIVGDPFSDSSNVPCAEGTTDLGTRTGYYNEQPLPLRLCAISEIPASGNDGLNPSVPGTPYYVEGANGHAIVNSRVSGAVRAMAIAARNDGVNLTLGYSFRPMELQEGICTNGRNPECEACYINGICNATSYAIVAKPGSSLHQSGTALDFFTGGEANSTATCASGRSTSPSNPMWVWLDNNAKRFGYGQYAVESWHWDPSEDGCGS